MSGRFSSENTAVLLRIMTKFTAALSERDFDDLLNGRATLSLSRGRRSSTKKKASAVERSSEELKVVLQRLETASSTQLGLDILRESNLTRAELEKLNRGLDNPVAKQDSVRRLEEKLVEALVGSRLNSNAVRGR